MVSRLRLAHMSIFHFPHEVHEEMANNILVASTYAGLAVSQSHLI